MKSIEKLKYSPKMTEAIELLDECDFSSFLEDMLSECNNTLEEVVALIRRYGKIDKVQLAEDYFTYYDWRIYLESRYNLRFHEVVTYVCCNPCNGITKNKI